MKLPMMSAIVNGVETMTTASTVAYNEHGVIPIFSEINSQLAAEIVPLIYLARRDITLCINSPGGDVLSAVAICDAMKNCGFSVTTVCLGTADSAAALLLSAGTPGKRYAVPNSSIMIHQVSSNMGGTISDVLIAANQMKRISDNTTRMLADYTGKSVAEIIRDIDRDKYMSPEEAQTYGIIDHIGRPANFYN